MTLLLLEAAQQQEKRTLVYSQTATRSVSLSARNRMKALEIAPVEDGLNLFPSDLLCIDQMLRGRNRHGYVGIHESGDLPIGPKTVFESLRFPPGFAKMVRLDDGRYTCRAGQRRGEHAADEEMRVDYLNLFPSQKANKSDRVPEVPSARSTNHNRSYLVLRGFAFHFGKQPRRGSQIRTTTLGTQRRQNRQCMFFYSRAGVPKEIVQNPHWAHDATRSDVPVGISIFCRPPRRL